jgi:hypothetical protein
MPTLDGVAIRNGPVRREATVAGTVPAGTIILRSGVRWLVTKDDLVEESWAQPLTYAVVVPTAAGGVLVGADETTVYRFDDPLGAGVAIYETGGRPVRDLGAVPRAVHVEPDDVYVDVATGVAEGVSTYTPVPASSVLYVDERRAVARFAGTGELHVTRDGGRSWAPAVERRRSCSSRTMRRRLVHVALEQFGIAADAPRDIRWIAGTCEDPLYVAVTSGVLLASGRALVAEGHWLAHVDLQRGEVLELLENAEPCRVAATREGPLAVCGGPGSSARRVGTEPLVLSEGTTAGRGLELRTAPSGALALLGDCVRPSPEEAARRPLHRHYLCVRQPDGTWATVEGLLPRVDGTAVLWTRNPGASVASIDRHGARRVLATLPADRRVEGVSEDRDGRLWLLARDVAPSLEGMPDATTQWLAQVGSEPLAWTRLAQHPCALGGNMTVCVDADGALVRAGLDAPWLLVAPVAERMTVSTLGFAVDHGAHLGFEQGELPRPTSAPDTSDYDATIECRSTGPERPGPNVADAQLQKHAKANAVEGLFSTKWSAMRLQKPRGGHRRTNELDDFDRIDRLGRMRALYAEPCRAGAGGQPRALTGGEVEVFIDGQTTYGHRAALEVLDDGTRTCLLRVVASRGDRPSLHFDARTGRGEGFAYQQGEGVRPLACVVKP